MSSGQPGQSRERREVASSLWPGDRRTDAHTDTHTLSHCRRRGFPSSCPPGPSAPASSTLFHLPDPCDWTVTNLPWVLAITRRFSGTKSSLNQFSFLVSSQDSWGDIRLPSFPRPSPSPGLGNLPVRHPPPRRQLERRRSVGQGCLASDAGSATYNLYD